MIMNPPLPTTSADPSTPFRAQSPAGLMRAPVNMAMGGAVPVPTAAAAGVADTVPAKLSEGEFVLPADVVRWHGLKEITGLMEDARKSAPPAAPAAQRPAPARGPAPPQGKPQGRPQGRPGGAMPMPSPDPNTRMRDATTNPMMSALKPIGPASPNKSPLGFAAGGLVTNNYMNDPVFKATQQKYADMSKGLMMNPQITPVYDQRGMSFRYIDPTSGKVIEPARVGNTSVNSPMPGKTDASGVPINRPGGSKDREAGVDVADVAKAVAVPALTAGVAGAAMDLVKGGGTLDGAQTVGGQALAWLDKATGANLFTTPVVKAGEVLDVAIGPGSAAFETASTGANALTTGSSLTTAPAEYIFGPGGEAISSGSDAVIGGIGTDLLGEGSGIGTGVDSFLTDIAATLAMDGLFVAMPFIGMIAGGFYRALSEDKDFPYSQENIDFADGQATLGDSATLDEGKIGRSGEFVKGGINDVIGQLGFAPKSMPSMSVGYNDRTNSDLASGWYNTLGDAGFDSQTDMSFETAEDAVKSAIYRGLKGADWSNIEDPAERAKLDELLGASDYETLMQVFFPEQEFSNPEQRVQDIGGSTMDEFYNAPGGTPHGLMQKPDDSGMLEYQDYGGDRTFNYTRNPFIDQSQGTGEGANSFGVMPDQNDTMTGFQKSEFDSTQDWMNKNWNADKGE